MCEVDREFQAKVGMTIGMDREIQGKVLDSREEVGVEDLRRGEEKRGTRIRNGRRGKAIGL